MRRNFAYVHTAIIVGRRGDDLIVIENAGENPDSASGGSKLRLVGEYVQAVPVHVPYPSMWSACTCTVYTY